MFTGVSGLTNHQARMDVVANNIANINTIGFKRGRVNFQDILSQTIQGASPPTTDLGGTNPKQVGLGMTVSSIDTLFTQGNLQLTSVNTDMAIQGDGMFMLADGEGVLHYTRAGTFTLDANGNLVNESNGYLVQGWQADASGNIDTSSLVGNILVPTGSTVPPQATEEIDFSDNIDGSTYGTLDLNTQTQIITDGDGAGNTTITWTFTPTGNFNEWTATGTLSAGTWASTATNTLTYTFHVNDSTGVVDVSTGPVSDNIDIDGGGDDVQVNLITVGTDLSDSTDDITITSMGVGADSVDTNVLASWTASTTHTTSINVYDSLGATHTVNIAFTHDPLLNNTWTWTASGADVLSGDGTLSFNNDGSYNNFTTNNTLRLNVAPAATPLDITTLDFSNVTQYSADSTLIASYQDGYEAGFLNSFTVGTSGVITGIYTNGVTQSLAQVALANFVNPSGLLREGENMFAATGNSGLAQVGTAETGGRGSISPGTLEMSNVDIAQEFVDMITAQRGFQVNSRSITTSDEILQEAINLKR